MFSLTWFSPYLHSVGFIILGINICQSTFYFQNLAKRDHILTRAWAFIIGILTLASVLFQTYINWLYSIDSFIAGSTNHASVAIGTTVVLYSTVIMWVSELDHYFDESLTVENESQLILFYRLAQFFWLSCIKKLLFTKPRMAWFVITPIAFVSLSSFVLAIAVAVISRLRPGPHGAWPTSEICEHNLQDRRTHRGTLYVITHLTLLYISSSLPPRLWLLVAILFRCALGLDLAVDISVLIVIVSQLALLKKSSGGLKTTITKLSWILCLSTFVSTVMVVGELYTSIPQSVRKNVLLFVGNWKLLNEEFPLNLFPSAFFWLTRLLTLLKSRYFSRSLQSFPRSTAHHFMLFSTQETTSFWRSEDHRDNSMLLAVEDWSPGSDLQWIYLIVLQDLNVNNKTLQSQSWLLSAQDRGATRASRAEVAEKKSNDKFKERVWSHKKALKMFVHFDLYLIHASNYDVSGFSSLESVDVDVREPGNWVGRDRPDILPLT